MQDTFDTIQPVQPENTDAVELASIWYPVLLSQCSVRANNVLRVYRESFSDEGTFFQSLMNITGRDVMNLRNCGRLTAKEILKLSEQLRIKSGYTDAPASPSPIVSLPSNIDSLLPLIKVRIESLSIRAKNAISCFLCENGNSVKNFYMTVTAPSFKAKDIKNIGRNTVPEVQNFIECAISFIEEFPDEISVDSAVHEFTEPKLTTILIPEEHQERIKSLQEELGYFPLFAAVSAYLDGLDDETKTIAENCIRIHEGQQVADRNDIGYSLGITHERVRQKRNKIIESLAEYFSHIRMTGFIDENPYRYMMTRVNEDVNASEGTDFSLNFVNFVLSSTFDDVKVVGDIHKALTNTFYEGYEVALAPANLFEYFNFDAFAKYLDQKLEEKRIEEEKMDLKTCMSQFYKIQYYEDYEKDVENVCRSILYISYPVDVDMGKVIFKANMRKSNYLIVEDILREAGHPMTLDEIYNEFLYQYPERSVEYASFRGTIGNNDNILPIGRSSTYALKEWNIAKNRGGTIRTFVTEYLDSLDEPIATVEDVGDYVRQFRPDTVNNNITSNICQEKTQKYALYKKDGVRYIGYRQYQYREEYELLDFNRVDKRSTEESISLLKAFIDTHHYFPLHKKDDDEQTRLYRFADVMRSLYNRGKLPEYQSIMWREFDTEYGKYRVKRADAANIDLICSAIRQHCCETALPEGCSSVEEFVTKTVDAYLLAKQGDE